MADLLNPLNNQDEDQQNLTQAGQPSTQQPQQNAGTGSSTQQQQTQTQQTTQTQPTQQAQPQQNPVGGMVGNAAQSTQPQQSKTQNTGTGFVSTGQRVSANQAAANRLGQQVAQRQSNAAAQAQSRLRAAYDRFSQKMQASQAQQIDPATMNAILEKAASNPASLNEAEQAQYKRYLEGNYVGPQGIENEQALLQSAQAAAAQGNLGSSGARIAALQSMAGGGYGAQQSSLDELLLGTAGRGQLAGAEASSRGLVENVAKQSALAQGLGTLGQANVKEFAKKADTELGSAYEKQIAATEAAKNQVLDRLAAGQPITKAEADMLGIGEDTYIDDAAINAMRQKNVGTGALSSLTQSQRDALKKLSLDPSQLTSKEAWTGKEDLTKHYGSIADLTKRADAEYEQMRSQVAPAEDMAAAMEKAAGSTGRLRDIIQASPGLAKPTQLRDLLQSYKDTGVNDREAAEMMAKLKEFEDGLGNVNARKRQAIANDYIKYVNSRKGKLLDIANHMYLTTKRKQQEQSGEAARLNKAMQDLRSATGNIQSKKVKIT